MITSMLIRFSPTGIKVSRYWWKFVHNGCVHPLMAFPWEPKWIDRLHNWTFNKWGG